MQTPVHTTCGHSSVAAVTFLHECMMRNLQHTWQQARFLLDSHATSVKIPCSHLVSRMYIAVCAPNVAGTLCWLPSISGFSKQCQMCVPCLGVNPSGLSVMLAEHVLWALRLCVHNSRGGCAGKALGTPA